MEFRNALDARFWMYSLTQFVYKASILLKTKTEPEVLEEIEKVEREQLDLYNENINKKTFNDKMRRFPGVPKELLPYEYSIKRLADSIPGGCGCDERKQWFNNNFPYNMNK